MKFPKHIKLIPSDFTETGKLDSVQKQFMENDDCPIARALKRRYPNDDVSVGVHSLHVGNHWAKTSYIGWPVVKEAFEKIQKTSRPAIIKVEIKSQGKY